MCERASPTQTSHKQYRKLILPNDEQVTTPRLHMRGFPDQCGIEETGNNLLTALVSDKLSFEIRIDDARATTPLSFSSQSTLPQSTLYNTIKGFIHIELQTLNPDAKY